MLAAQRQRADMLETNKANGFPFHYGLKAAGLLTKSDVDAMGEDAHMAGLDRVGRSIERFRLGQNERRLTSKPDFSMLDSIRSQIAAIPEGAAALMGEDLPGLYHHGDTDGARVPASVSERPLVHEGRMVALYRVYRDPSPLSTSNSDAWPSLSEYRPVWVGKMRDAGAITAGGRISIECAGFESLLERNMATGSGAVFAVLPEFSTTAGVDDQVAIYLGTSEVVDSGDGTISAGTTCQGRRWTTLSGDFRAEVRDALADLIADTVAGIDTDYRTSEPTFDATANGDAGFTGDSIYVEREPASPPTTSSSPASPSRCTAGGGLRWASTRPSRTGKATGARQKTKNRSCSSVSPLVRRFARTSARTWGLSPGLDTMQPRSRRSQSGPPRTILSTEASGTVGGSSTHCFRAETPRRS